MVLRSSTLRPPRTAPSCERAQSSTDQIAAGSTYSAVSVVMKLRSILISLRGTVRIVQRGIAHAIVVDCQLEAHSRSVRPSSARVVAWSAIPASLGESRK